MSKKDSNPSPPARGVRPSPPASPPGIAGVVPIIYKVDSRESKKQSDPAVSVTLKYAKYEVWPDKRLVRTTLLSNGLFCDGTRDEHAWQNIREAESQGYKGIDCVWKSLVEHELLHSLVAEVLFDRPSLVITTEAGGEFTPLWQRYEEEAICLAFQAWINSLDTLGTAYDFLCHYGFDGGLGLGFEKSFLAYRQELSCAF